jgi:hypothetical protein
MMGLDETNKATRVQTLCLLLIVIAVSCISILAWVPPGSRDALTHHLFVPKLYLQQGGIYEIPYLKFSYYPMNLDLLYLVALYFKNDILPKFIHFAFALATAALIHRYLKKRIGPAYGLLGALFFLTLPVIVRLSSTVYVDLGLIFFLFAAILTLFSWIESGFQPKHLIASAVLCGLALGTKYNGLVGLFLLGLFCAFVYVRYHAKTKWKNLRAAAWCASFVFVALLVFSPWMIRNFAWTGNPVYPLYNSIIVLDEEQKAGPEISHIQYRRQVYDESWAEIALIPLRVFFQGQDDTPQYFDGKTSPFLVLLPVFAFFGIRSAGRQERTEKFILLFFSILFLFYACAQTSIRIRYFSPILPPLVILAMFGLHNLQAGMPGFTRRVPELLKKTVIFCLVLAMLGLNVAYMAERFAKDKPFAYISGRLTRDQYIQEFRPEYASFQYANKHLSQHSKILGLYLGNRGYYSDIPIEFSNDLTGQGAGRIDSRKQLARHLRENGFTHLLINLNMFNQKVGEKSPREKKILKEFFESYTIKRFAKDGYGLLQIAGGNEK